ncbi:hypothetical protein POM88_002228 [Heracleum sosnowskyi]|uniref:Uncharacterized protein n=1 Tax=Heracleum sosnowskyi TaxID=360622 RepID=A0AAD8JF41_9APIA|nr:hypothetical protein POM88_002228 [Heracleum sosnowskyi]
MHLLIWRTASSGFVQCSDVNRRRNEVVEWALWPTTAIYWLSGYRNLYSTWAQLKISYTIIFTKRLVIVNSVFLVLHLIANKHDVKIHNLFSRKIKIHRSRFLLAMTYECISC